jgi:hypothetical protein
LPAALRYAWPVFGASGREADPEKRSFYFQLARQRRAAHVFGESIGPADLVLKWRPDLRLFAPIGLHEPVGAQTLFVPGYDNHYGLNDQVALGSWSVMRTYLSRMDSLRPYLAAGGRVHPETYLRWAMRGTHVARLRIAYAIDRAGTFAPVRVYERAGDFIEEDVDALLRAQGVTMVRDATLTQPPLAPGLLARWFGRLWQAAAALAPLK